MIQQQMKLGLLVLAALLFQLVLVAPTYACSTGLDFNPVAESDLIVGGRITAWERLPAEASGPFTPIRLTIAVDERFKGETTGTLQFVDYTSLSETGAQPEWRGSSGACGVFDGDPTGQYLVLGLNIEPDGGYRSNLMLLFFRGPEPAGDAYSQALSWLDELAQRLTPTAAPTSLPPTATSTTVASPRPTLRPINPPAPQTSPTADTGPTTEVAEPAGPSPLTLLLVLGVAGGALAALAFRRRRLH